MKKVTIYFSFLVFLIFIGLKIKAQTYCTAAPGSQCCEWITNVTVGSINNTSGASSYTDYTTQSTTMVIGTNYALSVQIETDGAEYVLVWVDWDHNYTFDTYEVYTVGSYSGTGLYTFPTIYLSTSSHILYAPIWARTTLSPLIARTFCMPCGLQCTVLKPRSTPAWKRTMMPFAAHSS